MTDILTYVQAFRNAEAKIAVQLGTDLDMVQKEPRVLQVSTLAIVAVLAKTLVDNGIITDAQLQSEWQAAVALVYPPEPSVGGLPS